MSGPYSNNNNNNNRPSHPSHPSSSSSSSVSHAFSKNISVSNNGQAASSISDSSRINPTRADDAAGATPTAQPNHISTPIITTTNINNNTAEESSSDSVGNQSSLVNPYAFNPPPVQWARQRHKQAHLSDHRDHHHHQQQFVVDLNRKDTLLIKKMLQEVLGATHGPVYWQACRDFLAGKIKKRVFDDIATKALDKKYLTLHNNLIFGIIHNIHIPTPPPPLPSPSSSDYDASKRFIPSSTTAAANAAALKYADSPLVLGGIGGDCNNSKSYPTAATTRNHFNTFSLSRHHLLLLNHTHHHLLSPDHRRATSTTAAAPNIPKCLFPIEETNSPSNLKRKAVESLNMTELRRKVRLKEVTSLSKEDKCRLAVSLNNIKPFQPLKEYPVIYDETFEFDSEAMDGIVPLPRNCVETRDLPSLDMLRSRMRFISNIFGLKEPMSENCVQLMSRALDAHLKNILGSCVNKIRPPVPPTSSSSAVLDGSTLPSHSTLHLSPSSTVHNNENVLGGISAISSGSGGGYSFTSATTSTATTASATNSNRSPLLASNTIAINSKSSPTTGPAPVPPSSITSTTAAALLSSSSTSKNHLLLPSIPVLPPSQAAAPAVAAIGYLSLPKKHPSPSMLSMQMNALVDPHHHSHHTHTHHQKKKAIRPDDLYFTFGVSPSLVSQTNTVVNMMETVMERLDQGDDDIDQFLAVQRQRWRKKTMATTAVVSGGATVVNVVDAMDVEK